MYKKVYITWEDIKHYIQENDQHGREIVKAVMENRRSRFDKETNDNFFDDLITIMDIINKEL